MKRISAFTLIELLITIAIIGLLTGLLVTNVSRSLSTNRLADDITLMESKIEYIRLLAGSNQRTSSSPGLQTDVDSTYYALLIPAGSQTNYKIVRISSNLNGGTCSIPAVLSNAPACLVETNQLNSGDVMANAGSATLIAFKSPVKQLTSFTQVGPSWQANPTTTFPSPLFQLTYNSRTATVNIDSFTGRLTAVYN